MKSWTEKQNAHMRQALDGVPGRKWIEERLWQTARDRRAGRAGGRRDRQRGRASAATSTPAAPASRTSRCCTCATGVDGAGPGAGGREHAVQRTAPGRWTGGSRRRTAATSPTACRPTATRSRCCTCATCRPARICPTPSPAPAPLASPGGPTARASITPATRCRARCRRARRSTTATSTSTGWAATPTQDPKIFGDGRDLKDWPSVALSPDGRWLAIEVSQGWAKSEVFLLDTRRKTGAAKPVTDGGRARRRSTGWPRCWTTASTSSANEGAPRYRVFAVDLRKPGARALEGDHPPERRRRWRGSRSVGRQEADRGAVPEGRLLAACACSTRAGKLERGDRPARRWGRPAGCRGSTTGSELFFGFTLVPGAHAVFRYDLKQTASSSRLAEAGLAHRRRRSSRCSRCATRRRTAPGARCSWCTARGWSATARTRRCSTATAASTSA